MRKEEHVQQVMYFRWLGYTYPDVRKVAFAVPNGGKRCKMTAVKLKAEGVTAGVSDIIILRPNKTYHGLVIEMKAKNGKVTKPQEDFLHLIYDNGFAACLCYTLNSAINVTTDYLLDRNIKDVLFKTV